MDETGCLGTFEWFSGSFFLTFHELYVVKNVQYAKFYGKFSTRLPLKYPERDDKVYIEKEKMGWYI
jgi:hypothetical protein